VKKIYILLSRTNTVPARIIRTFAKGEFSHVSVSLFPRTDCFYSYARRHINIPLFAGFVSEDIHTKVFARYPHAHCALFSIEVSDEGYERAKQLIRIFRKNRKKATYNFLGAATVKMGISLKRKYKFTCSQFAAFLLDYTGDVQLPKDPYLMLPNDFLTIPNIDILYDGELKDCVIPQKAQKK
jgi:hypothetical protein